RLVAACLGASLARRSRRTPSRLVASLYPEGIICAMRSSAESANIEACVETIFAHHTKSQIPCPPTHWHCFHAIWVFASMNDSAPGSVQVLYLPSRGRSARGVVVEKGSSVDGPVQDRQGCGSPLRRLLRCRVQEVIARRAPEAPAEVFGGIGRLGRRRG